MAPRPPPIVTPLVGADIRKRTALNTSSGQTECHSEHVINFISMSISRYKQYTRVHRNLVNCSLKATYTRSRATGSPTDSDTRAADLCPPIVENQLRGQDI